MLAYLILFVLNIIVGFLFFIVLINLLLNMQNFKKVMSDCLNLWIQLQVCILLDNMADYDSKGVL